MSHSKEFIRFFKMLLFWLIILFIALWFLKVYEAEEHVEGSSSFLFGKEEMRGH